MSEIKVGDKVARLGGSGDLLVVKTIKAVNPHTISVGSVFLYQGEEMETSIEPKQNPEDWRVAVPEIIAEINRLFKEADRLCREARELYGSLPRIEL